MCSCVYVERCLAIARAIKGTCQIRRHKLIDEDGDGIIIVTKLGKDAAVVVQKDLYKGDFVWY